MKKTTMWVTYSTTLKTWPTYLQVWSSCLKKAQKWFCNARPKTTSTWVVVLLRSDLKFQELSKVYRITIKSKIVGNTAALVIILCFIFFGLCRGFNAFLSFLLSLSSLAGPRLTFGSKYLVVLCEDFKLLLRRRIATGIGTVTFVLVIFIWFLFSFSFLCARLSCFWVPRGLFTSYFCGLWFASFFVLPLTTGLMPIILRDNSCRHNLDVHRLRLTAVAFLSIPQLYFVSRPTKSSRYCVFFYALAICTCAPLLHLLVWTFTTSPDL